LRNRGAMSGVPLHFIAIVVLVATAGSKVGGFFGVQDPTGAVFFISAWMLPLTRLKLRSDAGSGLSATPTVRQRPTWFLVLGALPWIALPSLHVAFPHSWAWQSLEVPPQVRWIGMAMTIALFFGPLFRSALALGVAPTGAVSLRAYALSAAAVILISTNFFILAVAAGGMLCLYLSERDRSTIRVADAVATRLAVAECAWREGCQPVS
jgi:hypothetical protein